VADILKDAESAVSAVSTVESVAGGAAKLVGGAASGLLAGFMPYILGILGAVIVGLVATVFYDHYVTIPHWKAQDAIDVAAVATANAATAEANNNLEGLRNVVTDDNRKLEALAHSCLVEDQAAVTAGVRAVAALAPPPPGLAAADVMSYWNDLLEKRP
jgi:hypothetical protein